MSSTGGGGGGGGGTLNLEVVGMLVGNVLDIHILALKILKP